MTFANQLPAIVARYRLPVLLASVAILNGLAYIFVVPPWQHYDEPNHFEYVWLAANQESWPQPGDYDQAMRRQVAESMIHHNFFADLGFLPELENPEGPIYIGQFSQLDDPPIYYWMASLPLRLLQGLSMTRQLYLARGVSLLFFIATILCIYGTVKTLFPPKNPLVILAPLGIALLPPFADIMTAVNNDAAAILFFSGFLMGMVVLLKQGFSLKWLLFTLLMIALGLFSKRTTFLSVPIFAIFAPMIFIPRRWRWAWRVSVAILLLIAVLAIFGWGEAALWHRNAAQAAPLRVRDGRAVWGSNSLALEARPGLPLPQMTQFIPLEEAEALAGQIVTLGGWFWADRELLGSAPVLNVYEGNYRFEADLPLTTQPTYHAWRIEMPLNTWRAWVMLAPFKAAPETPAMVYADGLFLVTGDLSAARQPILEGNAAKTVRWESSLHQNLLRNGSFERAWPYVHTWADELSSVVFPDYRRDNLSVRLYTLLDVEAMGWYYQGVLRLLLRSFWGVFGWAHVSLPAWIFPILTGITSIGIFGTVTGLLKQWKRADQDLLVFLPLAGLSVWGLAAVRGAPYVYHQLLYPVARYGFTAVLPAYLAVLYGWYHLMKSGLTRSHLQVNWLYTMMVAAMLTLNGLGLYSIYAYYTGIP